MFKNVSLIIGLIVSLLVIFNLFVLFILGDLIFLPKLVDSTPYIWLFIFCFSLIGIIFSVIELKNSILEKLISLAGLSLNLVFLLLSIEWYYYMMKLI